MMKCSNCGSNNPEDIKICLTCSHNLTSDTVLIKDKLNLNLDFDQPLKLDNQIRDYFFKTMKFRIETELDSKGYRKYFDHFHSTGFYKKFDIRVQQLSEEVLAIHAQQPSQLQKIEHLVDQTVESFIDYFILFFCEPLHHLTLPEAILRYGKPQKKSLDLGQMILDFLDFENEKDKVYTDFLSMPVGKLKNANEAFLFAGKEEKLIFICDQTVFGSCKEGFAMTDQAIYWKAHFNQPGKAKFDSLESIKREGEWITVNGQFFNVNKTMNYKMMKLLQKIQTLNKQ